MVREPLVERLSKVDSCAVSDALDSLGLKGATWGIRPQWPCPRIVGRAMPMKIKPVGLEQPTQHLGMPAIEAAEAVFQKEAEMAAGIRKGFSGLEVLEKLGYEQMLKKK